MTAPKKKPVRKAKPRPMKPKKLKVEDARRFDDARDHEAGALNTINAAMREHNRIMAEMETGRREFWLDVRKKYNLNPSKQYTLMEFEGGVYIVEVRPEQE